MVIPERTQCCLEIKLLGAGDYLSPSGGDWLPAQVPQPWWLPPTEEETETPLGVKCLDTWHRHSQKLSRQRGHQTELLGSEQPKSPNDKDALSVLPHDGAG